jgi:hypothetical protein
MANKINTKKPPTRSRVNSNSSTESRSRKKRLVSETSLSSGEFMIKNEKLKLKFNFFKLTKF